MKTPDNLPIIGKIAKYTIVDELRNKSFVVMLVVCVACVSLIRGCYGGNYMVNGQALDAGSVARALSKVTFHCIAVGVMVMAALLSMQLFRRDRNEGMQSCVLSKPVARWQYLMGKVLGIWLLSVLFMFILHGMLFLITFMSLQIIMPEYLLASFICAMNLLFVVIAVLLLSLMMPDIVAFLCVLGVGIVGFVADGIAAASQSQMGQAMMPHTGASPQPDATWWKVVYYAWPKLLGVQQLGSSLLESRSFPGVGTLYPLINITFYSLLLGVILFKRFMDEDIA